MAYFKRETDIDKYLFLYKDCIKLLQKNKLYFLAIYGDYYWLYDYDLDSPKYQTPVSEKFEEKTVFSGFFQLGAYGVKNVLTDEDDVYEEETKVYFTMDSCPFRFNNTPLFLFPLNIDTSYSTSGTTSSGESWSETWDTFTQIDNSKIDELNEMVDRLLQENLFYRDYYYYYYSETYEYYIYIEEYPLKVWMYEKGWKDISSDVWQLYPFYIFSLCNKETKEAIYAFSFSCSEKYFWKESWEGQNDTAEEIDLYGRLFFLNDGAMDKEIFYQKTIHYYK